jgi:hypothetical protein
MTFGADVFVSTQDAAPRRIRSWRAAADAFITAVRAHELALNGEEALHEAFASTRPFFPQALRDALYLGAWSVPVSIDCLDAECVERLLRERRYLNDEIGSLVAVYRAWHEATMRVEAAIGLKAMWDRIRAAADARENAFLAMLDTPPPDLEALAEKIALTADVLGWSDDPRMQQVATLAQDARRLCGRL